MFLLNQWMMGSLYTTLFHSQSPSCKLKPKKPLGSFTPTALNLEGKPRPVPQEKEQLSWLKWNWRAIHKMKTRPPVILRHYCSTTRPS